MIKKLTFKRTEKPEASICSAACEFMEKVKRERERIIKNRMKELPLCRARIIPYIEGPMAG